MAPNSFILEDVTGAGKTEAALILAHRLMAAGKRRDSYFGLPTMATANAMFEHGEHTAGAVYPARTPSSLILAHSARRFNGSFQSVNMVGHSFWYGRTR